MIKDLKSLGLVCLGRLRRLFPSFLKFVPLVSGSLQDCLGRYLFYFFEAKVRGLGEVRDGCAVKMLMLYEAIDLISLLLLILKIN